MNLLCGGNTDINDDYLILTCCSNVDGDVRKEIVAQVEGDLI